MRTLAAYTFFVATFAFSTFVLVSPRVSAGGELRPWNRKMVRKLKATIVKKIDFEKAKPLDVFKYLRKISKTISPDGKSVNFVFKRMDRCHALVTIKMENIPLFNLIKHICDVAGLDYKIEEYAIVVQPKPPKKSKATQH